MAESFAAPSFLPATCVLELTRDCNHKCLFCSCPWEFAENKLSQKKELSISDWKLIIKSVTEKGAVNLAFTGGEPLLKVGWEELIAYAASCEANYIETKDGELKSWFASPKIFLLSNGLLMSHKVLELCKKYNVHLSMSLPGLATFKEHTLHGDPDKILYWFSEAKKIGLSTTVNVTVTKKNLFELYETIAMALIAGAETLLMNRFLPGGRGLYYEKDLILNQHEVVQMLDIAEEVLQAANRKGSVGTELPKCIFNPEKYKNLSIGTECSAAIDFYVIGPSGFVRVCNHSPVELCHYSELESLKTNFYWKKFVFKEYKPAMCSGCNLLYQCDGGCREAASIVSGSLCSPDPIFNYAN